MRLGLVFAASLILASCGSSHDGDTRGATLPRPTALPTLARLLASFPAGLLPKTRNGQRLLLSLATYGVLGPQRVMTAVVPLDPGGGNSGPCDLLVFGVRAGRPVLIDVIRNQFGDFSIADGRLTFDAPDFSNHQPHCCPTQHRISRYGLAGGHIVLEQSNLAMYPPSPAPQATVARIVLDSSNAQKQNFWETPPSNGPMNVPSPLPRRLVRIPVEADCEDDTIQAVSDDGSYIVTTLDHKYHVEAGDEATSMTWLPTEEISICGERIVNKDESDSVAITPY